METAAERMRDNPCDIRVTELYKNFSKPIDNRFFRAHNAGTLTREEENENAERNQKTGAQKARSEGRAQEGQITCK